MSAKTKIAWCDSTVNPVHGCDKVSAGCANCYITTTTPFRVSGMKHGDPRTFHPSALKMAEKLNRKPWICDYCGEAYPDEIGCSCSDFPVSNHRRRIFWESLGDIWDPKWQIEWLAATLDTIRRCDQCTHILVSKRWENFIERMADARDCCADKSHNRIGGYDAKAAPNHWQDTQFWIESWYEQNVTPPNIIGLCSVENQETADSRIPQFLTVPLACHGLSMEPLLGEIRLKTSGNPLIWPEAIGRNGLKWLIIGGESGANARPMEIAWVESIAHQATAAGVSLFIKQDSGKKSGLQGRIPDTIWNRKEFPKL